MIISEIVDIKNPIQNEHGENKIEESKFKESKIETRVEESLQVRKFDREEEIKKMKKKTEHMINSFYHLSEGE